MVLLRWSYLPNGSNGLFGVWPNELLFNASDQDAVMVDHAVWALCRHFGVNELIGLGVINFSDPEIVKFIAKSSMELAS